METITFIKNNCCNKTLEKLQHCSASSSEVTFFFDTAITDKTIFKVLAKDTINLTNYYSYPSLNVQEFVESQSGPLSGKLLLAECHSIETPHFYCCINTLLFELVTIKNTAINSNTLFIRTRVLASVNSKYNFVSLDLTNDTDCNNTTSSNTNLEKAIIIDLTSDSDDDDNGDDDDDDDNDDDDACYNNNNDKIEESYAPTSGKAEATVPSRTISSTSTGIIGNIAISTPPTMLSNNSVGVKRKRSSTSTSSNNPKSRKKISRKYLPLFLG